MLDFEHAGYVHRLTSTSRDVVLKFALSASGREAGRERTVTAGIADPPVETAPASSDDVLRWLAGLEESGPGSRILRDGGTLVNQALEQFGLEHHEAVCRRLFDLRDDGLILFEDPGAQLQRVSDADRLGMAEHFRLSAPGRDRAAPSVPPSTSVMQIVNAVNAQVAAGDITNYVSFEQLLDRVDQALTEITGVDEEARAEARGMLEKLRGVSGTIATGTVTGAGGALLGTVLKHALGLP